MATGTFNPSADNTHIGYEIDSDWYPISTYSAWVAGNIGDGDFPSGMLFSATGIPQGSTINSASLVISGAAEFGSGTFGTIYGVAIDAPSNFSTSNRPTVLYSDRTTASLDFTDANYASYDLTSIIQELVDRAGFNGNIQIIFYVSGLANGNYTYSTNTSMSAYDLNVDWTEGGSSEDALLADDIASGTPTVGTPSIGQEHALTGDDVTAGTPTLSTPALAEVSTEDALLADDISAGTPTVGTPSLGQEHALLADDVAAGTPTLSTPSIAVVSNLLADDLSAGTPTVSAPTIGQEHNLLADDLASGAPIVTSPSVGQEHALTADDVASGTPSLGNPSLAQAHVLLADDIVSGTPVVTEPSVGQSNVLLADDIAAGTPSVTTPEIGQVHALSGNDIASGTPTLSTPAISTDGTDGLSAEDISTGVPTVSAPTMGQVHALLGDDISSGAPTVSEPSIDGAEAEQPQPEVSWPGATLRNRKKTKEELDEERRLLAEALKQQWEARKELLDAPKKKKGKVAPTRTVRRVERAAFKFIEKLAEAEPTPELKDGVRQAAELLAEARTQKQLNDIQERLRVLNALIEQQQRDDEDAVAALLLAA